MLRPLLKTLCASRLRQLGAGGGLLAVLLLAPGAFADDEPAAEPAPSESGSAAATGSDAAASDADSDWPLDDTSDQGGADQAGEAGADQAGEDEGAASQQGTLAIPGPPTAGVEEIVITGEMLDAVVDDRAKSVIGFDEQVLKLEGISDIRDLSNFTPSLEIKSAFAASNPTIFIRGVGLDDFNANAASAVAIYQDGVYMQSPAGQLFQFFDTENVQVLRGPQPSLYRSASAGAILVTSKKPTDEPDLYMTATYGNYNLVEVEGGVGGPILPSLSGRLSGSWGIRDGITRNRCSNQENYPCNHFSETFSNPTVDPWTNDMDAWASRIQLLWKPPTDEVEMEWLLNVHGGQNLSKALQFDHVSVVSELFNPDDPRLSSVFASPPYVQNVQTREIARYTGQEYPWVFGEDTGTPPYADGIYDGPDFVRLDRNPFAGDYDVDGPEHIDLAGGNLHGTWLFGDGYELRSLTAVEWHDRHTKENSDANPTFLLVTDYDDDAWQLSQQLDLHGNWAESDVGSGSWVLGAYYLQETLNVDNYYQSPSTIGPSLEQTYTQKTKNFAAYMYSEYNIQPGCSPVSCDFTLITGLRYNVEYKNFDTFVCAPAIPSERGVCSASALSGSGSDLWDGPDGLGGEVSLAWNFREDSSIYAKFSRGWKGGHFNGGALSQFDVISGVNPEIVDSYEGGLRSLWFDGRLMLNATGFYYDYQDLQVFQLEQTPGGFPIPKLVNANDAVVYGVELDMGATPFPGLNLTYNFAWVESEYKDFVVSLPFVFRPERKPGAARPDPVRYREDFDYSGNPLIASPRFSMTGSAEYSFPLPGSILGMSLGYLSPRVSFSWKDDVYFDACSGQGAYCNFPKGTFGQPAFWVFNSTLTWRSESERFELTGWVHNILDEEYKTQSFDLHRGYNLILNAYAEPRTFGITGTFYFR